LLMPVRAKQPREATRIQLLNLRCGWKDDCCNFYFW
jgi:hypothetical protein